MLKQRKTVCAVLLSCLMLFNIVLAVNAAELRVESMTASDNGVAPCFVAIWECARGLSLVDSSGKLSILAGTDVYPGYTAGVTVLLQKKVGSSWVGVTSWEDADGETDATVGVYYTVDHGTYRTQCTHRAYYPSGNVAETFVAYSDEVTY